MLRRPHDRHRDIRTRTRFARLFARRTQDRHIMIEIASSPAPQLGSLLPLVVRPRRSARPKILRPTLPSTAARTISSHDRQRTPHRYALSFEIVFDGHCDHSPTDAGDSQIPIARAADRRPSDSRFPSLEVFERRPRLGPTAASAKGRHPKTFTQPDVRDRTQTPAEFPLKSLLMGLTLIM